MDKTKALGEEKVSSLLWKFSGPAIFAMMVNALYNVVDSIFVGHGVGEIGLTAVTIAFPMMMVLMAIGMLIGMGSSTLVSIRLGENNKEAAELILGNAFTLIMVLVLATTAGSLIFLDPILIKLGAAPDVLPYARDFARVVLGGSIFMHISFGLNSIIRAQGDQNTAVATMLVSAFLNMILNPLFIIGLHMGIKGSAWATVIAQAVAATWVMVYFIRGGGTLKLKIKCIGLRLDIAAGIFKIGMSGFLMQITNSLVMVIVNYQLIAHGGSIAIAAYGVLNRIIMMTLMPVLGIMQGAQPIIGYNYGAKKLGRVITTLKLATLSTTATCVVCFILVELFAVQIMHVFSDNAELATVGAYAIRINLSLLPLIGFQIAGAQYFQAVGKVNYAIVLNLLRQVILLIPVVSILPGFIGLMGVWLAEPISDLGAAIITGICVARELKRLSAAHKAEQLLPS
ncbi:MAG: efflux family protein [Firmicutes bacterium]|nr:efflux family protein [Bacillota bacterium]